MSDGSYFDDAPQQSAFGTNQDGGYFNDPVEAAKAALSSTLGLKQLLAGRDYATQTLPLVGELFQGEADFDELFTILDSTLDLAVNAIEGVEALMALDDLMLNDPSGMIGAAMSNAVSVGLTFLLEYVQPIQDLFGMLTGNAGRIRTSKAMWTALAQGISPVGTDLLAQAERIDGVWHDDGADAARLRLAEGNDVIQVAAALALGVGGVLEFCACVFDKVQGFCVNRAADVVGLFTEAIVKFLMSGPKALADILIDIVPMLLRITLELCQIGLHVARAFGALVGLMTGAGEAVGRMTPYIERMGQTAGGSGAV
jgi:hypothetical protein